MTSEIEIGTATITSKNMLVIPKKARKRFHLSEGQKIKVFLGEQEIILSPLLSLEQLAGILKSSKSGAELITEARQNISRFDSV